MRQILEDPLNAAEIADFKRLTFGVMVSGGIITMSGFIIFLRGPVLANDDLAVTAVTISSLVALWVMAGGIVVGSIGKIVLACKLMDLENIDETIYEPVTTSSALNAKLALAIKEDEKSRSYARRIRGTGREISVYEAGEILRLREQEKSKIAIAEALLIVELDAPSVNSSTHQQRFLEGK